MEIASKAVGISAEVRGRSNGHKQIKRCSTPLGGLHLEPPTKCNVGSSKYGTAFVITVPTPSGKYDFELEPRALRGRRQQWWGAPMVGMTDSPLIQVGRGRRV